MVALLAGCDRNVERSDNFLRVAIEARPGPLDPRHSTDAASGRIGEIVFSRLVKYNRKLEIVPDLAERWEISEDGKHYRFHLREGVRFHDGSSLDAEDVAFTFRSLLEPALASPKRKTYEIIERIEVEDPRTISFHLREPNAPFLTNVILGILPREADTRPEQTRSTPVGSGPFRVVANENGAVVRLEAFEQYYGGRPPLDGIEFRYIAEPTLRVLELQKGTIDFLQNDLIPEFLPALRQETDLKVQIEPGVNSAYLGMNLRQPGLDKLEVRQAIAHAIDRDTIQALILRDTATVANSILGPSNWAHNPDVQMPAYDPARARKLLDEAGFPDPDGDGPQPRLSLSYKTSTDKVRLRIAEVIRRNLGEVGIRVQIQSYEFSTFFNDIKTGNFELFSLIWVGISDPDILYLIFHSSMIPPEGLNRVFYSNPLVDSLVEQGRVEPDVAKRRALYWQVQAILADELPLITLYYVNNYAVMRSDVQGFELYPAGNYYSFAQVHFARLPAEAGRAAPER